jgi:hypothetical protein
MRTVRILGSAIPDDVLLVRAQVTGRLGGLIQAEAECRVADRLILTAGLTLSGDPPF